LEAALADIERQGVDEIICLGDVATLGAQPNEVISRLQALGARTVLGNHDAFLIERDDISRYTDQPEVLEMVDWCKAKMSTAELDYLRTFEPLFEVALAEEATMLCFHGSPRSNTEIILAKTPDEELAESLDGHEATVMAGGHTHIQMLRRYFDTLIINPGSVGAPFWEMPPVGRLRILPWCEYCIVEWQAGVLQADMRRIPVDLDAVHAAILASDMANPGQWLEYWE
jgi:predicted phosphodiesterase